jgi:hypothetical protein
MKTHNIPILWSRILIVLVSIVPGFLVSLVFILGGQPFEVQGQNSAMQETLGGCAAVFLFSTACQFWLTRMGGGGLLIGLLVMAGMFGTSLITCAHYVSGGLSSHNWPMLVSGSIGSLAGILLSVWRARLKRAKH